MIFICSSHVKSGTCNFITVSVASWQVHVEGAGGTPSAFVNIATMVVPWETMVVQSYFEFSGIKDEAFLEC
jgi:hypothetical protein